MKNVKLILKKEEAERDIRYLEYVGSAFLELYNKADKENDWLLYWEEAM